MKKNKKPQNQKLSPKNYLKLNARALPIYSCFINDNWKESGLADVVIARKHNTGNITYGVFLIDLFCRGLKDCFFHFNVSILDFEEALSYYSDDWIKTDYTLAHNIIWGGSAYGEDNGFPTYKDFSFCQYILEEDSEDIEFIDIEFGKNGKPLLLLKKGENIQSFIKILDKNVGHNNYKIFSDAFEEDDEEIETNNEDETDFYIEEEIYTKEGENVLDWTSEQFEEALKNGKEIPTAGLHQLAEEIYDEVFRENKMIEPLQPEFKKGEAYNLLNYLHDKNLINELTSMAKNLVTGSDEVVESAFSLLEKNPKETAFYLLLIGSLINVKPEYKEEYRQKCLQYLSDNSLGKILYLASFLLDNNTQFFEETINGKFSLNEFIPEKDTFDEIEIKYYYLSLFEYYILKGDVDKAESIFAMFENGICSDLKLSDLRIIYDSLMHLKNTKIFEYKKNKTQ